MEKQRPLGRYRSSYSFFGYMMVVMVGFGLGWGVVRMSQGQWSLEEVLWAVAIASPILGCITLLAIFFFVTEVYDWGLRTYDALGIYHKVQWHQISRVKRVNIGLGYKYLLICIDKRPMLLGVWVPLFLDDMEGFRKLVLQTAPPANPVRSSLESNSSNL